MKKYKIICGLIGVFVALSLNAVNFEEVISRLRKSVIPIKFSLRIEIRGQETDREYIQIAIVINDELVVITDGGVISGKVDPIWGQDMKIIEMTTGFKTGRPSSISKPKNAYGYIGKDTKVPAEFLGLNKKYDLAYFKLKPKDGQKLDLQPLQVIDESKINLNIGDEVYTLTLDTKERRLGFPFHKGKQVVSYQFEGGKYDFSIGMDFEIILDKNLNILGFGFESPLTRMAGEGKEGDKIDVLDYSRYGLLFTKSKIEEIVKNIPKGKDRKVGWLGFLPGSLEKVSEELREELKLSKDEGGLRVTSIPPNTPVDKGGLKVNDIIVGIGGKKTVFNKPQEMQEFMAWLNNELEVGKEYEIKFLRNEGGKYVEKKINVTAIEKPVFFDEVDEVEFKGIGIKVKPLTFDYRYYKHLPDEINGVVVVFARMGDPFNVAGVGNENIILAMGDSKEGLQDVKNIDDLKKVLKKLVGNKVTEVLVKIYITERKEVKMVTLRLGEKNYKELEKDLENK